MGQEVGEHDKSSGWAPQSPSNQRLQDVPRQHLPLQAVLLQVALLQVALLQVVLVQAVLLQVVLAQARPWLTGSQGLAERLNLERHRWQAVVSPPQAHLLF